ncbi:MAG: hypothetical protein KJ050_10805 [Candidatus Omnitrophica bacterium]|nr:hypothetical protein [Candidatus Omnitrophota bacterium]
MGEKAMRITFFSFLLATVSSGAVDFASVQQIGEWLHHPVLGDPSFDSFQRLPGNPVYRGTPPFEWPVNGFLFEDPVSQDWFLYIGLYAKGYAMGPGRGMDCVVYRSNDRGGTWEKAGPVFPEAPFRFQGASSNVGYAPDVSVVFDGGRYHMIYDWASEDSTWETMTVPKGGADNGIGYAWSEKPEGPYIRTPIPIYSNASQVLRLGKYRRAYAATLIRRTQDWMVLAMMDSGPSFSWALFGMTSDKPEGPYSEPTALLCVESTRYHPPLLEFFPAFTHEGWIYAPATSVAANRNFQAIFRAPLDQAHHSEAWEIHQAGSVWHSEPVENEYSGIWGQTFSGSVGNDGQFTVMFPSRDPQGMGTINLAKRPWAQPLRGQGFILSGHKGPSLSLLRQAHSSFALEVEMTLHGKATLVWDYQGFLGPDAAAADSVPHPLSLCAFSGLVLSSTGWKLIEVPDPLHTKVIAEGPSGKNPLLKFRLEIDASGNLAFSGENGAGWKGPVTVPAGRIGWLVDKNSHLEVHHFNLSGATCSRPIRYLPLEGVLGAGAANKEWQESPDASFASGAGMISLTPQSKAKWNVSGKAFTLMAPRGPEYGTAEVFLDGTPQGEVAFHANEKSSSGPVLHLEASLPGPHAVLIRVKEGRIPLDCLEVDW